jgi:hypothetical protein
LPAPLQALKKSAIILSTAADENSLVMFIFLLENNSWPDKYRKSLLRLCDLTPTLSKGEGAEAARVKGFIQFYDFYPDNNGREYHLQITQPPFFFVIGFISIIPFA